MKTLPRSTPAVVIGVALLILLTTTGGAVAGGLITSKQIKDNSVTSADIKNKTITSKDIAPSARGIQGKTGAAGPRGFSGWDVIPSGTTVIGDYEFDGSTSTSTNTDLVSISLPGVAPVALTSASVGFAPDAMVSDADATCTGSVTVPTAPAGKVCVYLSNPANATNFNAQVRAVPTHGFVIQWKPGTGTAGDDMYFTATWAYTAP